MPIEFRCSQCNQLLRVPDDSAGKSARCPKCQALMTVPAGAASLPSAAASSAPGSAFPAAGALPLSAAGGSAALPRPWAGGGGLPPPPNAPLPGNPFGEAAGSSPFGAAGSLNPYASPQAGVYQPFAPIPSVAISPRPVPLDAILNYAWQIWQANLGLLLGITVTVVAVSYAISIPFGILQVVLQQNGEQEASVAVNLLGSLISGLVQMYLGIGQAQIGLKLARRQPATFSDLFGGASRFLPVLGAWILAALALFVGFLLLFVPGVLMLLAFWPFYYLLVDEKTGVIESFSVAAKITQGNWATAFLLWLVSIGIMLLGCLALCIGMLFAAPLVAMQWAVAYLMMSGQLSIQPWYGQYAK